MPNRFELKQLREAAEKHTYHDADTHGAWPRLVWERRNKFPVARLDDAVEFLGKWKALRCGGGKTVFRRIRTTWLRKNRSSFFLESVLVESKQPENWISPLPRRPGYHWYAGTSIFCTGVQNV